MKILIIGTNPWKNIDRISKIASELPRDQFYVIGRKIDLFCSENVIQIGSCSENELSEYYRNSDLLLYPSLKEGFGLPILEAQFFGVPVITSKWEPMASISGGAAILVDPKNMTHLLKAVEILRSNQELRSELIRKGLENVQNYSASAIQNLYNELYLRVIKH